MTGMGKATYRKETINCTCGKSFRTTLETRLSDSIWDSSCDSQLGNEESYVCPQCSMQYRLEITVEKTVTTTYSHLEVVGRFIDAEDGSELNIAGLEGKWVGESTATVGEYDDVITFPDGVFISGGKEYHVKSGIITAIWGLPDDNQINLFEEIAA